MKTKTKDSHKLTSLPPGDAILCGRGRLTWDGRERRSDRYGTVHLLEKGDSTTDDYSSAPIHFPPGNGILLARVIEARKSTHIGDFFRGLSPRTPEYGDILLLGSGTVFRDDNNDGFVSLGVRPDDGRDSDWLNPRALYDCHESVVELIFIPRP